MPRPSILNEKQQDCQEAMTFLEQSILTVHTKLRIAYQQSSKEN